MIERSDVVEAPVPSASTWSVTSPAAQAKSSSLLLSEDIKPTNKKRRLNEDIVEKVNQTQAQGCFASKGGGVAF